jgi:hypothetical protein
MRNTDMPRAKAHNSPTAPGRLANPGSERNSRSVNQRSSKPMSEQEGSNTRSRFGSLESEESGIHRGPVDPGKGRGF